jgi:hypothetical protein
VEIHWPDGRKVDDEELFDLKPHSEHAVGARFSSGNEPPLTVELSWDDVRGRIEREIKIGEDNDFADE